MHHAGVGTLSGTVLTDGGRGEVSAGPSMTIPDANRRLLEKLTPSSFTSVALV